MFCDHDVRKNRSSPLEVFFNFMEITLRRGWFPVNLLHIFRTPFPWNTSGGLVRNFIEISLRHGCYPVNLLHIFRTAFPKNISGELPLEKDRYICKTLVFGFRHSI